MSIRITVKEFCEKTGAIYNGHEVDSMYRLMHAADMNPDKANAIWKGDMKKIGLDTIEVLCRTLGCTPNDLFAFDPPLAQFTPAVRFTRAHVDATGRVIGVTGRPAVKVAAKPVKKVAVKKAAKRA